MSDTVAETTRKVNPFRRAADRVFGGINMSWPKVIIFAVAAAFVTAIFLIVPIFDNTSFREMGVYFESWVLFAILIMVNCKKPLESALKTFVFFLISQPLIYLIQVPFSDMGWSLFGYYRYWFIATLFTFPAAYLGWYVKRGNWPSLLIITPINLLLADIGVMYLRSHLLPSFPDHLISVLFCFGQIVLYLLVFFRGWKQRVVGAAVAAVFLAFLLLSSPGAESAVSMPVTDDGVVLSDQATIRLEDESWGDVSLSKDDAGSRMFIHLKKDGEVKVFINDGDTEFIFTAEIVYENGHSHVEVNRIK